jgi:hypothetical protein
MVKFKETAGVYDASEHESVCSVKEREVDSIKNSDMGIDRYRGAKPATDEAMYLRSETKSVISPIPSVSSRRLKFRE